MKSGSQVILYYKYVTIVDPAQVVRSQRELCERLGLNGRILISKEGINGTLEGTNKNIEKYVEAMNSDELFSGIHFKYSEGTSASFPGLSIKAREEIVTSGFGAEEKVENRITGKYLKPEELKKWIESGKEFYIVDMRNDYEQKSGYFEGSILSNVPNFRDIPKFIPKISHLKEKQILTVCTGGVRCEKASGYLMQNGFQDVYQLEGGIHSYMEKYPNEDFKGKLYVFDKRILVGFNTEDPKHEVVSSCERCGVKSENYVNCSYDICHRHYIVCDGCYQKSAGFCNLKCRFANGRVFRMMSRLVG
ncbi:MAG TPA: rhodanese-related sulfurtransferase [Candidatus Paceibacterota bacterium]